MPSLNHKDRILNQVDKFSVDHGSDIDAAIPDFLRQEFKRRKRRIPFLPDEIKPDVSTTPSRKRKLTHDSDAANAFLQTNAEMEEILSPGLPIDPTLSAAQIPAEIIYCCLSKVRSLNIIRIIFT
jgi:hypothetical protein